MTLAEHTSGLVDGVGRDGTRFWSVVCFGPHAGHAAASLTEGARVIAVGALRTRA